REREGREEALAFVARTRIAADPGAGDRVASGGGAGCETGYDQTRLRVLQPEQSGAPEVRLVGRGSGGGRGQDRVDAQRRQQQGERVPPLRRDRLRVDGRCGGAAGE